MELYIHRSAEDRVELREVEATISVVEAVTLQDGEFVWLEESEVEVDVTATVTEAHIPHRGHVHVNRCREVRVTVNYNGRAKEHSFHPATRIERVFDWATGKDGFDLTPTDRTEEVLQICNTTIEPDEADHVGSFAKEDCSVCFSLVHKHRFEG
jgi:hypothetical protein